jgi:hypothetical protein
MARSQIQAAGEAFLAWQYKVWAQERALASIAAGNQPNRTPGPKFLASRGIPSGGGEVGNRGGAGFRELGSLTSDQGPDDFFTEQPQAMSLGQPVIAQPLAQNVPPAFGASGNLKGFLDSRRRG